MIIVYNIIYDELKQYFECNFRSNVRVICISAFAKILGENIIDALPFYGVGW
jgi:hypothetical protein